jgi:hypothetical protein
LLVPKLQSMKPTFPIWGNDKNLVSNQNGPAQISPAISLRDKAPNFWHAVANDDRVSVATRMTRLVRRDA